MSLSLEENQRSLCLHMSVTFFLVPPAVATLQTGLPAYPTHSEGGEAESVAAAEDAVWRGETLPSVCLSASLGFQGDLPGGRRSVQAFLCVPTAHVAQEKGWSFKKRNPLPQAFLKDSSLAFSFLPPHTQDRGRMT